LLECKRRKFVTGFETPGLVKIDPKLLFPLDARGRQQSETGKERENKEAKGHAPDDEAAKRK
jgi:hypothetical protein